MIRLVKGVGSGPVKMGDKPAKGDVEAGIADHTDVSAYIETSHHTENTHSHVRTFAVEENQRNTADNPHREGTSVAPILIRRVNSEGAATPSVKVDEPAGSESVEMGDKPAKDDVEACIADHTDVSAYVETSHNEKTDQHFLAFAVEEHQQNTADNPHREGTSLAPILVRRADSEELLPRPLKSMNQLVGLSYLSFLCCLVCAAYAVDKSWRAKLKRNDGLLSSASDEARSVMTELDATQCQAQLPVEAAQTFWRQRVGEWYPNFHSQTYFVPPLHFNRVQYDLDTIAGQSTARRSGGSVTRVSLVTQVVTSFATCWTSSVSAPPGEGDLQYRDVLLLCVDPRDGLAVVRALRARAVTVRVVKWRPPAADVRDLALAVRDEVVMTNFSVASDDRYAYCKLNFTLVTYNWDTDRHKAGTQCSLPFFISTVLIGEYSQPLPHVFDCDVKEDRAQQHVLEYLRDRAESDKEVMMFISQLQFRQYLDKQVDPITAAAACLPRPCDVDRAYKRGDFDVLIVHHSYGLIVGEIKSVGDDPSKTPDLDKAVVKRVERAVKQLEKSETVLKHLVSDVAPVNITKALMLPNVTSQQLLQALSTNAKVQQAIAHTGLRMALLTLHPGQVELVNRPGLLRVWLIGPPGTGKTVVLVIKGLQWLHKGRDVHVLSSHSDSRAAAFLIHQQLLHALGADSTAAPAAGPRVHLHLYDFVNNDKDVEDAVNTLAGAAHDGQVNVITDEALNG
nr:hypothetical protein BaRGS_015927 [Batillaria attramentaria]